MVAKVETVVASQKEERWLPVRGDATASLGAYLVDEKKELPDTDTFEKIVQSSLDIVSRCKPFTSEDGSKTGLVVGYVQSGKTMSMTTVASLARDSGCRLVILLAGVTEILLKQTARQRLRPYLLNKPDQRSGWRLLDTVDNVNLESRRSEIAGWLEDLRRPEIPEDRRRPIFITVMKNHAHLAHLHDLLSSLNLKGLPALVMDDEADQAGLDTNAARQAAGKTSEASTTHRRITDIRRALPNHTYLQYTATAQGPLLISLANILSPDFACVLEPGAGYTGGTAFFIDRPELVRSIPRDALFDVGAAPPEPPDSLVEAMREFFIGVAVGLFRKASGHRSMLIHPSPRKDDHDAFLRFARNIKKAWERGLRLPSTDPSHEGVLEEFRVAYDDLKKTAPNLPTFDEVATELSYALGDTPIWKVNSEDGNEVDWDQSYSHILVGGDKLNRGYTVEGLTVTYMPRTPGSWNADTIQQRARFFGYKAKYLGLCRIYLHHDVEDAYREYVQHEEDVRAQLKEHQGRPLREWKRTFLLDHRMHPTRANILSERVERPELDGWFRQNYPHVAEPDLLVANRDLADRLIEMGGGKFLPDPRHPAHSCAELRLQDVFDAFLVDYHCFEGDMDAWFHTLMWLGELLQEKPEARCFVVNIEGGRPRERALDKRDKRENRRINQLFQGHSSKRGGDAYPGDEAFRKETMVTLQLHRLNVIPATHENSRPVSAIAVRFPEEFARDVVVQRKKGQ